MKSKLKKYALLLGAVSSLVTANPIKVEAYDYDADMNKIAKKGIERILGTDDEILKTEDYSLVRIHQKIYLCESHVSHDYDYDNTITKYYSCDNLSFVGQTTSADNKERLYSDSLYRSGNDKERLTYSKYLKDANYFGGEYDYQKNLPKEAVIPLTELCSSEYPTKEELDFFRSDSRELHNLIESKKYFANSEEEVKLWYHTFPFGKAYKTAINGKLFGKYTCQKNGKTETFYGYRCSDSVKDNGYNQLYDVVTGNVIYVGQSLSNAYDIVSEEPATSMTIQEIKDELNISDIQSKDTRKDAMNIIQNYQNETSKALENKNETLENETQYKANEIFIFDNKKLFEDYGIAKENKMDYDFVNPENQDPLFIYYQKPEHYHDISIVKLNYTGSLEENGNTIYSKDYKDILCPNEYIWENWDYLREYKTQSYVTPWGAVTNINDGYISPIHSFLSANGLENLIQDSYTEKDLNHIVSIFMENQEKLIRK